MSAPYVRVVQLRLTSEEWRLLDELARLRDLTLEDLLREWLRVEAPRARRHLRVVRPESAA